MSPVVRNVADPLSRNPAFVVSSLVNTPRGSVQVRAAMGARHRTSY
jgi:hypothetical protein